MSRVCHAEILNAFYDSKCTIRRNRAHMFRREGNDRVIYHYDLDLIRVNDEKKTCIINSYPSNSTKEAVRYYISELSSGLKELKYTIIDNSEEQYGYQYGLCQPKSLLEGQRGRKWYLDENNQDDFMMYYNGKLNTYAEERDNHNLSPRFPSDVDESEYANLVFKEIINKNPHLREAKKYIMFLFKLNLLSGEKITELSNTPNGWGMKFSQAIMALSTGGFFNEN